MKFIKKPKNIFLLDGFGALLTTLLLFFVLRTFNDFFGLSKSILGYLAALALVFSIYSIFCYFLVSDNWKSFLKIICAANIFYCFLTIGILVFNYHNISIFGIAYFLGEIAVIVGIVFLEIKMIREK
ncbi:hypothetical protein [Flavobacterium chungangense]|uniref:Uncharacterized protein n=1 Tax=Flavobacterium chungangense TaxID=554283 RepID=A0A6V6Z6C2_9FLAO|nr:hypothetical protein [Flavobacterium chungangense]CAD0007338.1 hypothetical protein FLACHUCJ7_03269 [Flavobacterium chungangense]